MNPPVIVDSHVHLWDPACLRYPWLESLPSLNRSFLPAEYLAAIGATTVSKIIFVECGCEAEQSLPEVDWITNIAQQEPRLKAVVAQAALEKGEAVRADLEELANRPLVHGVRRNLQGESEPDFCLRPEFITGVKLLADFGFSFDVCIRPGQLWSVAELARRVPQVSFILDHAGKPNIRDRQFEPWASDLKALAALPNVSCKVSGLTTEADWQTWRADDLKFYLDRIIGCFGFERVMFGGDWPVATLATHYERWVQTVYDFLADADQASRNQFFQINAERIYDV